MDEATKDQVPQSPPPGTVVNGYRWDGSHWVLVSAVSEPGTVGGLQVPAMHVAGPGSQGREDRARSDGVVGKRLRNAAGLVFLAGVVALLAAASAWSKLPWPDPHWTWVKWAYAYPWLFGWSEFSAPMVEPSQFAPLWCGYGAMLLVLARLVKRGSAVALAAVIWVFLLELAILVATPLVVSLWSTVLSRAFILFVLILFSAPGFVVRVLLLAYLARVLRSVQAARGQARGAILRRWWVVPVVAVVLVLVRVVATVMPAAGVNPGPHGGVTEPSGTPDPRVIATIRTAVDGQIALDPAAHRLYVSDWFEARVLLLDSTSFQLVDKIAVTFGPGDVAIDPGAHALYVTFSTDDCVWLLDSTTNRKIAEIPTGDGPEHVAVDPVAHTAYVTNALDNTVSVIDTRTRRVTGTIPVASAPQDVAVDALSHRAYVTTWGDDAVQVIDTGSGRITATIPVASTPTAVATDDTQRIAYVIHAYKEGDNVSVIDTMTGTVIATTTVGKWPQSVAIDPGTHTAYVANAGDETVTAIDTTTHQTIATIGVPEGARDLTVDPLTHLVYVQGIGELSVLQLTPATPSASASPEPTPSATPSPSAPGTVP